MIPAMTGIGGGVADTATHEIAIESYGVRASVGTNSAYFFTLVESALPPGWRRCDPAEVQQRFYVRTHDGAFFDVEADGDETTAACDLEMAVAVLESRLKRYVAEHAPERIFVHAGAVASGGRAILIPGPTFTGKTTLVSELLRAGAEYLSDEYAVLNEAGWVSPYQRPLAMRSGGLSQRPYPAAEFGAKVATEPVPVALVVLTEFSAGARWRPRRLTPGDGVLALLANTLAAQDRPKESLRAVSKAVEGALVVESERGEAVEVANSVLELLEGRELPTDANGSG
jgi:hypothetical protein